MESNTMKTHEASRSVVRAGAFIILYLTALLRTDGAEYLWRASWGVFPDQVDPSVVLWNDNTIAPVQPVLTGTDLLIQTPAQADYTLYDYSNLTMPTQLVIEAEIQCLSGYSAKAGRPYVTVYFTTGSGIGGLLGLEQGAIYLTLNMTTRGWTAAVNTDDTNHLYRIEVDTPSVVGSPIRVYQDGTLVMTGAIAAGGDWGTVPEIWFGEGTDSAYGSSRWRSFRHNAATAPSKPVMFIRSAPDEIAWTSHSNVLYNVQQCADLTGLQWANVFTNILGNGGTNRVSDAGLRTNGHGFYRLETEN
jgi:hypothetical protein